MKCSICGQYHQIYIYMNLLHVICFPMARYYIICAYIFLYALERTKWHLFFGILQSQISSKPKITCWLYCQDSWLRVRGQLYVFCSNFVELMVRKSHYCHEFCISVTWSADTLCHLMNLCFHYQFPYNIQFMCIKIWLINLDFCYFYT